jgi:predicted aldo/keto reductase-like oxidoreductase
MAPELSRRELLTGAAAAVAGSAAADPAAGTARPIPMRALGNTGVRVPILGFGTGPVGVKRTLKDAEALYNEAIDLGVTYIDTAPEFAGYGKAQLQLSQVVPRRRKEVFLVTKLWEPDYDDALRLLEKNLRELKVDQVDLLYAHSIGSDKMDPARVTSPRGTMAALERARKDGLTRFIGISGHNRPGRFLDLLERYPLDVMMNAVNMADRHTYGFETRVWPVAQRKKVALVAMKVFAGMGADRPLTSSVMPKEHLHTAFRYALGLPGVACAVIGMATREELRQNAQWARSFQPLSAAEEQEALAVGQRLAGRWGAHYGAV